MFLGLGVEWSLRRAPGMPLLEISATVPRIDIPNFESICLQMAMVMIKTVQKYDGLIIPPFGNPPSEKNIFFTAQFKDNADLENFLNNGWKKVG